MSIAASTVPVDQSCGVSLRLHPLVVMNISDHFTRANIGLERATNRAYGLILGTQTQNNLEVFTSFEAHMIRSPTKELVLDLEQVRSKKEQFAMVFPTYDCLGWYTTGHELTSHDLTVINSQVRGCLLDTPLILVLDPKPPESTKTLPVYVFETVLKAGGGTTDIRFRKLPYTLESEESERIGIDTAMKVDMAADKRPTLVPQAQRLGTAVSMLHTRISVVLSYLYHIQLGKIPKGDSELLRRVASLCNKLPCAASPAFRTSFSSDYEEALMIAYLSILTKTTQSLALLVEKSSVFSHERRGMLAGSLVD